MAEATETCTIEVRGIPRELLALLDRRVRLLDGTRGEYIRRLIERDLREAERTGEATFTEILGPARGGADQSGMTEEELEEFIEGEVKAYRAERRAKQASAR